MPKSGNPHFIKWRWRRWSEEDAYGAGVAAVQVCWNVGIWYPENGISENGIRTEMAGYNHLAGSADVFPVNWYPLNLNLTCLSILLHGHNPDQVLGNITVNARPRLGLNITYPFGLRVYMEWCKSFTLGRTLIYTVNDGLIPVGISYLEDKAPPYRAARAHNRFVLSAFQIADLTTQDW